MATYDMASDPAFCPHTSIKKSAKLETISVPELEIEQLVLRVRVYCKDCKANFVPKTLLGGFSTEEIGVIGEDVIVPLAYPMVVEEGETEGELLTQEMAAEDAPPPKSHLH